jgi:hypothetical protein
VTLDELLRIVAAGCHTSDLARRAVPAYTDFLGETVLVTTHDDDQAPSYRIRGHPFRKFGVRVWPETLPLLGLDPRDLRPGSNAFSAMVRVELNEDGKPKQVVGLAAGPLAQGRAASAHASADQTVRLDRAALQRFLVRQVTANFNPQATTTEQLAAAYEVVAEATELLQNVADKLRDARTVDARHLHRRRPDPGEECPSCGLHVGAGNACDVVLCPICCATLEWNGAWAQVSPQPGDDDDTEGGT